MRAHLIVMPAPGLDDDLGLGPRPEPLQAQALVAELAARMAEEDAPVLARMSELAAQYPRYGYRRVRIFLGRDGHKMSFGRAYRLWRQAKLQVPSPIYS